jgi:hypothetical protein
MTAVLTVGFAAPAFAEIEGNDPGGNVPAVSSWVNQPGLATHPQRLQAFPTWQSPSYEQCYALARDRGVEFGRSHETFVKNCMDGKIR